MTEIIQTQITSADTWIGSEMQQTDDWVWNLTEEDLSEIMPDVAHSLREVLDYKGNVEEDLMLTFQVQLVGF